MNIFVILAFFMINFVTLTHCAYKFSEWSIPSDGILSEYDYIIVGAGSSGSRLANKLSEKHYLQILVLEAGSVPPTYTEIPGFASFAERSPIDWNYQPVPQENACFAYANKSRRYISGKVVGGGSTIDHMLYQRGNRYDFDNWERQFGATGWGFDAVLPLFMADEGNDDSSVSTSFHGRDGALCVSSPKFQTPLLNAFLAGGEEMGYRIKDANDGESKCFSALQTSTCDGVIRSSAATAFLEPILCKRSNLHLSLKSTVLQILFEGKRAVGVVFERDGKTTKVFSRREVILSAGAIRTPQLLMLSGIGPKYVLDKLKIPVVEYLPVGENFQDHVTFHGILGVGPPYWQMDMADPDALMEYFHYGTGPLTSPSGFHWGIAHVSTKINTVELPDIQLLPYAAVNTQMGIPLLQEYKEEFLGPIAARNLGMYQIAVVINRPKSMGWIRLNSTDPNDPPLVNPRFFSNEADIATLAEGSKMAVALLQTKQFRLLNISLYDVPFPGCKKYKFGTEEYFRCLPKQMTSSLFHAAGTCRMGDASRKDVVVDPKLRVKGVEGLRVADASIMPQIVSGHPSSVCIMIGAKAADLIFEDLLGRARRVPIPTKQLVGSASVMVTASYLLTSVIVVVSVVLCYLMS